MSSSILPSGICERRSEPRRQRSVADVPRSPTMLSVEHAASSAINVVAASSPRITSELIVLPSARSTSTATSTETGTATAVATTPYQLMQEAATTTSSRTAAMISATPTSSAFST